MAGKSNVAPDKLPYWCRTCRDMTLHVLGGNHSGPVYLCDVCLRSVMALEVAAHYSSPDWEVEFPDPLLIDVPPGAAASVYDNEPDGQLINGEEF